MVWLTFLVSAAVVVYAANKLAEYGDVIAVRTKLGGLFVGTILLAGATSLPEIIASISSFQAGLPDLAAGNFLGSNMVNMMVLAFVDIINYQVPLLRRVAITHALTATLATVLMLLAVIFILADIDLRLGWVGLDSLILIGLYFAGMLVVQRENRAVPGHIELPVAQPLTGFPSLRYGLLGFAAAALALLLVVPYLVNASAEIAVITGLGATFVGTALLSIVTSLPELLAALAAVRIGAYDMAVGNLFGSSVFNILGLGLADFFYLQGRFLGAIDPDFVMVGLLGLLLTNMALVGNLARVERKGVFILLDSLAITLVYLLGMYLLFVRGSGI